MVRQDSFFSPTPSAPLAAALISPAVFDKRALLAQDPLPLANSLAALAHLASASASRIPALLTADGALEALVRLVSRLDPFLPEMTEDAPASEPVSRVAADRAADLERAGGRDAPSTNIDFNLKNINNKNEFLDALGGFYGVQLKHEGGPHYSLAAVAPCGRPSLARRHLARPAGGRHAFAAAVLRAAFSSALACVANLAVRGSMPLRLRLVATGVVQALIPILRAAAAAVDRALAAAAAPLLMLPFHLQFHMQMQMQQHAQRAISDHETAAILNQHQIHTNSLIPIDTNITQLHPTDVILAANDVTTITSHTSPQSPDPSQPILSTPHRQTLSTEHQPAHDHTYTTPISTVASSSSPTAPQSHASTITRPRSTVDTDQETTGFIPNSPATLPLFAHTYNIDTGAISDTGSASGVDTLNTPLTAGPSPHIQQMPLLPPRTPQHDRHAVPASDDAENASAHSPAPAGSLGLDQNSLSASLQIQNHMHGVHSDTAALVQDIRFQQQHQHHQMQPFPAPTPDTAAAAMIAAAAAATALPAPLDVDFPTEDLLLAVQLIAYISKYHEVRQALHTSYGINVYLLIERLTASSVYPELRKWAIVCMRSCFKRDGQPRSLRRCGALLCTRIESHSHEFSKCSRCRRVTYCSKSCQRTAWGFHRNWCLPSDFHSTAPHTRGDNHAAVTLEGRNTTAVNPNTRSVIDNPIMTGYDVSDAAGVDDGATISMSVQSPLAVHASTQHGVNDDTDTDVILPLSTTL